MIRFALGTKLPAARMWMIANPDTWAYARFLGVSIGQVFIGLLWRVRRNG